MHTCVPVVCIPDVWPSGHYGSGPRLWVCVCVCVFVGACMLVCVWYTELKCIPMYGQADIMGQVLGRVCDVIVCRCMHACVHGWIQS